uniref:Chemosensory protein CSP15 n=1 Tax=Carposina sasakii TaxID=252295 RepID=A0A9E8RMJ0_CARSA|nr:chemosensory protein CSP15 [Carposina sasakii]
MWTITIVSVVLTVVSSETTAPGIDRTMSPGVESVGFNLVYGDEVAKNQVYSETEKIAANNKVAINNLVAPLPPLDVKCLMSDDRHCTQQMEKVKDILIQAINNDCMYCSEMDKKEAGKVTLSMLVHDPVAWKLFLTKHNDMKRIVA